MKRGTRLAAVVLLFALAFCLLPCALLAQGLPRPSRAHTALNDAIACHRRGEYEQAAALFQQATAWQNDLTPSERQELTQVMQLNATALQARQMGADQLRQAEKALKEGRVDQAGELLKRVAPNQYLLPADRQKAQMLMEQLRPRTAGTSPAAAGTAPGSPVALSRSKLQQGRAMMAQGNFDAADALAREAEALRVVYPSNEDTPQKLRADIARTRGDAKGLLAQARTAYVAGDLDRAERLANASKKADSAWSMHLFGDSPDKVLKDVQASRSRLGTKPGEVVRQTVPPTEPESPGMFSSMKNLFGGRKPEPTIPAKPNDQPPHTGPVQVVQNPRAPGPNPQPVKPQTPPQTGPGPVTQNPRDPGPNPPSVKPQMQPAPAKPGETVARNPNTENARQLLIQARKAYDQGNLEQASKLNEQARKLKPELQWFEDNPEKLQADIQRASARNRPTVTGPNGTADSQPSAADRRSDDPRALLKQGRELFSQGNFDEADKVARRAKSAASATKWGLFEDSPDKLMQDLDKAKAKRNQEESWRVLAEGRELLKKGDFDGAARAASRAEMMHGPYSVWDIGDRPDKLRAEAETAKNKARKVTVPPVPPSGYARNDQRPNDQRPNTNIQQTANTGNDRPGQPTSPYQPTTTNPAPVDPRVRQTMADAWTAMQSGDRAKAQALLLQAENVQAGMSKPPDAGMVALRQLLSQPTKPQPAPVVDPAKQQAVQLLAQARKLQQEGLLVQARQKTVEALRVGAVFGPDEDSPEQLMLQMASLARKRIDAQLQQANNLVAGAASDPTNYGKAEMVLQQAQQLAAAFGLDAQPVEQKLAWVRQNSGQTVAAAQMPNLGHPPHQQPQQPPQQPARVQVTDQVPGVEGNLTPGTVQMTGRDLLARSRNALKANKLHEARQLAEQVASGQFGMQEQGLAMLRDIDAEENNQRRLAAGRTVDAAFSAFQRNDYAYTAALIRSIDLKLLEPDKQNRVKELMALPQMQPAALVRGPEPVVPGGQTSDGGPQQTVRVTDTAPRNPENSFALQVLQMQQIKFQELRTKGINAQNEAAERMKSGEIERAMEILQEYLGSLNGVQLASDDMSKLRRPIEARLQQYRILRGQREFEQAQVDRMQAGSRGRDAIAKAEEMKKQKVAELMAAANALYKEGKYKDAQYKAMLARELDPDNTSATAFIAVARLHDSKSISQANRDGRERMMFGGLSDSENEGVYVAPGEVHFDPKRWEVAKGRPDIKQISLRGKGPKEREIERKLLSPVNLNFQDTPLRQVIEDISQWQGIDMVPERQILEQEGISLDRPVTMKLQNVSLKSALKLTLEQVRLTYVVEDEVLKITTPAHAKGQLVQKVYQVADLVVPFLQAHMPHGNPLLPQNNGSPGAQPGSILGSQTTPYVSRSALSTGTPVGAPGVGEPFAGAVQGPGGPQNQVQGAGGGRPGSNTLEDHLIQLITNTIQPSRWNHQGGPGTIDYFPLTMALVINQTLDIHEQIADLLDALRRLQDQEVAVEVRFITVAEGFFERIGLDFNINIKTDSKTVHFEPQITTGQFKPAGFINDFSPSRFIAGLTPAGTFTSDLDIPIRTSSFAQALPPFGGFPNIPGGNGGISLGLAFLSDIQVFLFMEAAQGDQRTNVMQAPKITLVNGQTSSIFVQDQQFFVTNVNVIQNGGQIAFVPQNQNFAVGVNLTLQAVISADRRFVRLNMSPSLTNLASAIVPLFPIVTPIFPVFDGGFPGNPVLFTQFIQQPVFNTINVMTSVSVPDGGTVLLGGLKRLSEGRNEFGPPVLSKIPYVNRLFKNVGYGREVESLMLMVTPRIIINEEEERRQVPNLVLPQRLEF